MEHRRIILPRMTALPAVCEIEIRLDVTSCASWEIAGLPTVTLMSCFRLFKIAHLFFMCAVSIVSVLDNRPSRWSRSGLKFVPVEGVPQVLAL
jgi:hypothetical protein